MKNKRAGFIQIPILIAIVVGIFVVGGVGYVEVRQYKNQSQQNNQQRTVLDQNNKATTTQQHSVTQDKTQSRSPKQDMMNTVPTKRVILSNSEIIKRVKPATVYIETT